MRYHGIKGNIIRNADATELEDKFDILVDANDQLLERVVGAHYFIMFSDILLHQPRLTNFIYC